jgi:cation diffusion facilitator CzcD-associated flavoprotein CzcO
MTPAAAVRRTCRTCQRPVIIATCIDGELRGFDAEPSSGRGWWWSRRRGGMVAPGLVSITPVETYRSHRCPVPEPEAGPDGQLALPLEVTVPAPRPVPARVATGRRATR